MASSGLPFPTSNNAPQPIPSSFNPGGFNQPSSSLPFPTPSYNVGAYGSGTALQGLSTGLNSSNTSWNQNLFNELGRAFGKGTGQLLGDILSNGMFNPQVAAAFLNAQAPGIARGEAGIEGAFADAGARFSSASAIGMGDFESQVQLNQQQTLAQLYQQAQQNQLNVLGDVLPTLHAEEANHGGGLMDDIIGGLETVGGFAAAPFTGGASLALAGSGLSMLTGGGKGGGMSMPGQNPLMSLQKLFQPQSSPVDLSGVSMGGDPTGNNNAIQQIIMNMQGSGGSLFGGSNVPMPGMPEWDTNGGFGVPLGGDF